MMTSPKKDMFVWAHRGASAFAPENTMSAFRAAEAAGADGIELDVHLSRDGVPVVIHDETLDRTTSGHGPVKEASAAELLELDAGSWFSPDFSGEQVPLLSEVLAWAGERLRLNVEIKSDDAGHAVLDALKQFPQAKVLISSFNSKLLFRIRQANKQVPIGFLSDSRFWRLSVKRAVACAAVSYHPPERHVPRALVNWCHAHNLAVYPWTVDSKSRKRSLARIGADGYFSNFP